MRIQPKMILLGLVAAGAPPDVLGDEGPPAPLVEVVETPGGGVQPRAIVDASGAIHLVYLRGDAGGSDVYYSRRGPVEAGFGPSTRVNSEAGSAIAIGTVRGPRVAVDGSGRVHVCWNGSQEATPRNPIGGSPLLYTRSDEARARFEPQRNLMTATHGLDGGGSVAADGSGHVSVAWHGQSRGSAGEASRRIWIARSADEGASFSAEVPASPGDTGACGCCGLASLADAKGSVYVIYRAARGGSGRDTILLTSRDRGRRFDEARLDPWRLDACPMSTYSLFDAGSGLLAAWETRGQVAFTRVDRETGDRSPKTSPPGGAGDRKHPSLAANDRGETLLAWAEGTAWQQGGSLAWQAFDRSGRPLGAGGKLAGAVPVWGSPAVVARPDGGFLIIR